MRRGLRGGAIEYFAHLGGLVLGPFAYGRATSYGGILLLDFGRTTAGDQRTKVGLEAAKGNQICVCLISRSTAVKERSVGVHTNSLLRKSPTSSVVDGPPIFIKTIAVGPFDEVTSWVTGGTIVAILRNVSRHGLRLGWIAGVATDLGTEDGDACLDAWHKKCLSAICISEKSAHRRNEYSHHEVEYLEVPFDVHVHFRRRVEDR